MRSGALLLKSTEQDRYVEAPRLGTDIDVTVSGPTARARVTQIFRNPTDGWLEADGKRIYDVKDIRVGLFSPASPSSA